MSNKDSATPTFYMGTRENAAKTREMGRPMFDDVEMVRVVIPGDRLANFVDEVNDEYRNRWPDHYAAFKRGELRASTGTPLEHWPPMTTARVAEMKALNIFSVEDLAGLSDAAVLRLGMGGRELRAQAQAYISSAKDNAAMTALVAEVERLKQMLENRPASDPAPEPEKRRGRPPRAASEPASETVEA